VQNAVGYEDLGSATSGTTFFRSIGASFGVSIFGTIFATRLSDKLGAALRGVRLPPGFRPAELRADPTSIARLPASAKPPVLHAYSTSITMVFLYAAPVALAGFVLALFLKEQPLRASVTVPDGGETIATNPVERSSLDEIARALSVLGSREARTGLYTRITRMAGLDIHPATSWLLLRLEHLGEVDPAELARHSTVPLAVITAAVVEAETGGYATRGAQAASPLVLTGAGRALAGRLAEARRSVLAELLGDWDPARHAELAALVTRLSDELSGGETDHPERNANGPPAAESGSSA